MEWKANGLRHRLAKVKDVGQVAFWAGNSAGVIFGHYRELVRPAEATRWFAVKP